MLFRIGNEVYSATLRFWNGVSYEPDCFQDLESNFPRDHLIDDDGCVVCNRFEFYDLVDWWANEVLSVNFYGVGDVLASLSSEQIDNGCEWSFDYCLLRRFY